MYLLFCADHARAVISVIKGGNATPGDTERARQREA